MKTKGTVLQTTPKREAGGDSCITYLQCRHPDHSSPHSLPSFGGLHPPVASVDWYEIGAVVKWDSDSLPALEEARLQTQASGKSVTLNLGQLTLKVHRDGFGKGQESHMRYRISWGKVVIGIDARPSTTRQLYNFYFRAPGKACVVLGLEAILEFQHALIRALGGRIDDAWIKRIDVCLDIQGRPVIEELLQKLHEGCYVTSSRKKKGQDNLIEFFETMFAIRSQDIRLSAYDKIEQMRAKRHGDDYLQAMIQNRWGGKLPKHATRIEFRFRKGWLFGLDMRTAEEVLSRLGDVVAHATSEGPYPFFRITESVPDRKNGQQARAKTLPLWKWIIECLRAGFPATSEPLKRRKRSQQRRAPQSDAL